MWPNMLALDSQEVDAKYLPHSYQMTLYNEWDKGANVKDKHGPSSPAGTSVFLRRVPLTLGSMKPGQALDPQTFHDDHECTVLEL